MKAMEKKATPMPEELEREWNEVRVCFRLLQCRRARIVTKRMLDGSVEAIYRGQKGGWMRWYKEKKCTLNRAA